MARRLIVLALVFVAIVGLAAAAEPAPSTTDQPAAEAPLSDDFIGTDDGDAAGAPSADGSAVVPGPMGSSTTLAGGPASEKDGSATLKFSAIVGLIGGEMILKEAKLAEESLDSDGDGLLALEDLVGLMEAGGGEKKLHDLKENFSLSDIGKCGFITTKDVYSSICKPIASYGIPGFFKTCML
ncbi:hypothetical protein DKX38_018800 [Salix brachista]|uniref:EF-hand domain-containing protein n=1 Tax=Salix brachista TaxID=2182728 RepID=A0A5N5KP32_9ROSI|nr:hypothetical protein DKX38_018800 [Salix brachista]